MMAPSSPQAKIVSWTMQVGSAEQKCSRMQEKLATVQAEVAQATQRLGVAEAFRVHLERQLTSAQVTLCDQT